MNKRKKQKNQNSFLNKPKDLKTFKRIHLCQKNPTKNSRSTRWRYRAKITTQNRNVHRTFDEIDCFPIFICEPQSFRDLTI